MPDLEQLGTFLEPAMGLTYRGKQYRIQAVTAQTGAYLAKLMVEGKKTAEQQKVSPEMLEMISDEDEETHLRRVLGDTYDELLADAVSYPALKHISTIVTVWTVADFDTANAYFLAEGKTLPKNRAERRTATRTSTAAATTTRKRASASGTTTRKATASRSSNGRTS